MGQCWPLVHRTKRRSYGIPKPGSRKVVQSSVVARSAAYGIRRLAHFLPSRQSSISKFIIQARGNASHPSRVTQNTIGHSRGRPMVHAFSQAAMIVILPSQAAIKTILLYAYGIQRPGSRLVILGRAILVISKPLPSILLALSSHQHLLTTTSVSGSSQTDEPLLPSSTHPGHNASHSPWTASTSSAEVRIR
jgi:hypothetical protein